MIKRINSKILWAAVLVCTIPVYGQTDNSVVRLYLKDDVRNGWPETLPVYVDVATVQPDVEQGILFTFNIENNRSEPVRILNPVERISTYLYSVKLRGGVNLRNTETDAALCFIRWLNSQQLKAYQDDKKAHRPFQAFDSEDALRDQRMKTISNIVPWKLENHVGSRNVPQTVSERFEAIRAGVLTLQPGERFQAVLQITRVLGNPKGYKEAVARWRDNLPPDAMNDTSAFPAPEPLIVDIPPGTYKLIVSSRVFTGTRGASWGTTSGRVTIQLGEPSSAEE